MPGLRTARLPWEFATPGLEQAYLQLQKQKQHAERSDALVAVPWAVLWFTILWRHWDVTPTSTMLHSFCHFMVIISPSYLQLLLSKRAYLRHRVIIVSLALLAYVLHPGGGLYRDAVMSQPPDSLAALNLFVRLLVGSRTLFWLVLSFGYRLPPRVFLPLHSALLGLKMWLKPSQPFCAVMQRSDNQALFQRIAANLPLLSIIPLDRPHIREGADICNPLITWVQVGGGFVLPALVCVVLDFGARQRFIRRHTAQVGDADRHRWLSKSHGSCTLAGIAGILWVHFMTFSWYCLMYRTLSWPNPADAAAANNVRHPSLQNNGTLA